MPLCKNLRLNLSVLELFAFFLYPLCLLQNGLNLICKPNTKKLEKQKLRASGGNSFFKWGGAVAAWSFLPGGASSKMTPFITNIIVFSLKVWQSGNALIFFNLVSLT